MSGNRILFDTSALIEYLDSTEKGRKVQEALIVSEKFFTPAIVIAELISKLKRKNIEYAKFIEKIENSTEVLPLNSGLAKRAGSLHAELRKKFPKISLADCVVMAHGEAENALILTCDGHFEGFGNTKIL